MSCSCGKREAAWKSRSRHPIAPISHKASDGMTRQRQLPSRCSHCYPGKRQSLHKRVASLFLSVSSLCVSTILIPFLPPSSFPLLKTSITFYLQHLLSSQRNEKGKKKKKDRHSFLLVLWWSTTNMPKRLRQNGFLILSFSSPLSVHSVD